MLGVLRTSQEVSVAAAEKIAGDHDPQVMAFGKALGRAFLRGTIFLHYCNRK